MPQRSRPLLDWLDARTGYRVALRRLLEEPLPPGTTWWFTLGSVLLLLLLVQLLTGVVLMLYYAPTPDHAWDSVKFIAERVTFGRIVRNLHFYGASFLVVAAMLHLLRVFFFGSYKSPRELTWMTGVALLLVILAFSLSGYLLPWDQRAYWATVVTLNIARTAPLVGDALVAALQGGPHLGALTLSRWYAAHVILLPLLLGALVAAHLYLMRRHGISGPVTPRAGEPHAFYPDHAIRDAIVAGSVFVGLLLLAIMGSHQLEPVADPEDAAYVPRPEWYFLWMFQLLKYFPGRLEVIGAHVIPGLLVALLLLLPLFDRRPERRPWRRPVASASAIVIVVLIGVLTELGLRDSPSTGSAPWTTAAIGGLEIARSERCVSCHETGGTAAPFDALRIRRDTGWIEAHVLDPAYIGPGTRPPPENALMEQEVNAVLAYLRRLREGSPPPDLPAEELHVRALIGRHCINCHVIDGEGVEVGPRLTHAGRDRDQDWLEQWITDPASLEFDPDMPAFGDTLPAEDIHLLARHLASRK